MYLIVYLASAICSQAAQSETLTELPETVVEVETRAAVEEVPSSTSVATSVDPEHRAGTASTLADLMLEVPGVTLRRFGGLGSPTSLSLRGTSGENVLVVLDNVPMSNATLGPFDLAAIPLEFVERVEVFRGSGPIRFVNPLGGVIHLRTKAPTDKSKSSVQLGYGSFDTRTFNAWLGGPVGTGAWRYIAGINYQGSDGDFRYYNDGGTFYTSADDTQTTRVNNEFNSVALRLVVETDGPKQSTMRLSALSGFRAQGVPGPGMLQYQTTSARDTQTTLRFDLLNILLLDERLSVSSGVDTMMGKRLFADPASESGLAQGDSRANTWQFGLDSRIQYLFTPWHELELSPRVQYTWFRQSGKETSATTRGQALDLGRLHVGIGLEHRADLTTTFRLVPAVRIDGTVDDVFTYKLPAALEGPRHAWQASPKLGALWRPGICEWRANIGRYHRFPSLLERFGDGLITIPNPALTPEHGVTGDIGPRCDIPLGKHYGVIAEASAFATRATSLLVFEQTAQSYMRATNAGRSDILGAEASFSVRLWQWIVGHAAYTLTDAKRDNGALGDARNVPPGIARHRLEGDVTVGPKWAHLRYEILWASQAYLDRANLLPIAPRLFHTLIASLAIPRTTCELSVSVRNLGNLQYENVRVAGFAKPVPRPTLEFLGYPMPGRSWFAAFTWNSP